MVSAYIQTLSSLDITSQQLLPILLGHIFPQPLTLLHFDKRALPLVAYRVVRIMICARSKMVGLCLLPRQRSLICSLRYDYGRGYGIANNPRFAGVSLIKGVFESLHLTSPLLKLFFLIPISQTCRCNCLPLEKYSLVHSSFYFSPWFLGDNPVDLSRISFFSSLLFCSRYFQ